MNALFNLTVSARHVGQMGRELMTNSVTSLVELVKNSYDADAEGVKITFNNILNGEPSISVIDTGTGMTRKDVYKKWAVIGTNNKLKSLYSPKGRKQAGKKGIGRFSVESLAEMVEIISFPENEDPFKFIINWNKYEGLDLNSLKHRLELLKKDSNDKDSAHFLKRQIEFILLNHKVPSEIHNLVLEKMDSKSLNYKMFLNNKELYEFIGDRLLDKLKEYEENNEDDDKIEEIGHEIEELSTEEEMLNKKLLADFHQRVNVSKDRPTGLIIKLNYLRHEWTLKDINKVKKEMRLLVSPQIYENNIFQPVIDAKEFNLDDDLIINNILDLYTVKIDAEVSDNGKLIKISYRKRDGTILPFEFVQDRALLCGDVKLTLYQFLIEAPSLKDESINFAQARDILKEYCGVKIYRDGFRVKPYGEVGNDWLLLDNVKIKDTHGFRIGNNQVIGTILLTERDNPALIDATNREGIIENTAFEDLRYFVLECTNLISTQRYKDIQDDKNIDSLPKLEKKKDLYDAALTKEELERNKQRQEIINQNLRQIEKAIPDIQTRKEVISIANTLIEKTHDDLNFYREAIKSHNETYTKAIDLIESKQTEVDIYKNLATLGILTGSFGHETADIINRIYNGISFVNHKISDDIQKNMLKTIINDAGRLKGYSELIINFVRKSNRSTAEYIYTNDIIQNVVNVYNGVIESQKIEVLLNLSDYKTSFKMYKIDLESIIINLLTNSFEALKQTKNKRINIRTELKESHFELLFEDNGKGISKGYEDIIFNPFHTSKDTGVGLGLTIVKDIIKKYKGTISVSNSLVHYGALFKITFPVED
ncbi:sensor histidine kinase [Paenibacillus agaridevorans]|uniref:sensor histidine kinase n=1 Tax=Paenibacillus agaridevorans TaxID=171404 RepID=UPI001BE3F040|nr:sensor histidine kinase [Paenibacillus agaridevorans]